MTDKCSYTIKTPDSLIRFYLDTPLESGAEREFIVDGVSITATVAAHGPGLAPGGSIPTYQAQIRDGKIHLTDERRPR